MWFDHLNIQDTPLHRYSASREVVHQRKGRELARKKRLIPICNRGRKGKVCHLIEHPHHNKWMVTSNRATIMYCLEMEWSCQPRKWRIVPSLFLHETLFLLRAYLSCSTWLSPSILQLVSFPQKYWNRARICPSCATLMTSVVSCKDCLDGISFSVSQYCGTFHLVEYLMINSWGSLWEDA